MWISYSPTGFEGSIDIPVQVNVAFLIGSRERHDLIIFPFTLSHHSWKKKVASSSLSCQPLHSFGISPSIFENSLVLKHMVFQARLWFFASLNSAVRCPHYYRCLCFSIFSVYNNALAHVYICVLSRALLDNADSNPTPQNSPSPFPTQYLYLSSSTGRNHITRDISISCHLFYSIVHTTEFQNY